MADTDPNKIADAILKKLKESHHTFWIDPETHSEQHKFIKALIDERADKLARRKKIEDIIAGSIVLTAILTAVGFLGAGALGWLKGLLK